MKVVRQRLRQPSLPQTSPLPCVFSHPAAVPSLLPHQRRGDGSGVQAAGLLDAAFWPQWHGVLGHWLANGPDMDQVRCSRHRLGSACGYLFWR